MGKKEDAINARKKKLPGFLFKKLDSAWAAEHGEANPTEEENSEGTSEKLAPVTRRAAISF